MNLPFLFKKCYFPLYFFSPPILLFLFPPSLPSFLLSFQSSFHPSLSCFLSFCFCFYYPHQIVGIICLLGFFFKCLFIYLFILLISHPFYTHHCIHVNPNLPIYHTTTPTHRCFPPLVPIGLFSTSVSQFPLCKLVHLYHFLGSTYMR